MSNPQDRIPLTWHIPRIWVSGATLGVFFVSMAICLKRGMDMMLSLVFSLATSGIAAICWHASRNYLRRIPYALVSAPVLLLLFWSLYAVGFPLGYFLGGETYSLNYEEFYVKAQVWTFLGTLMLCLGLSVFTKRFQNMPFLKTCLSPRELRSLKVAWWFLLALSSLIMIQAYTLGLFGRTRIYTFETSPFTWITAQASYLAPYALLLISIFILSNYPPGLAKKLFFKQYQLFTSIFLLYLLLRLGYRWMVLSLFLVFVGYCAYNPYRIRRYLFILFIVTSVTFPLFNTMRTTAFKPSPASGEDLIREIFGYTLKESADATFFKSKGIEKTNEFTRLGDTFEFTAAAMSVIPERQEYFFGNLLLQDLKLSIPYMFWPKKFSQGPIIPPETLINIRVTGNDTDTGFGPIVYLWAEGGPFAVLIGMFLFGLIYGYIYWKCISKMQNGLSILLYSLFALSLTELEEDWIMNVIVPLRLCFVAVIIWYVINVLIFSRNNKNIL